MSEPFLNELMTSFAAPKEKRNPTAEINRKNREEWIETLSAGDLTQKTFLLSLENINQTATNLPEISERFAFRQKKYEEMIQLLSSEQGQKLFKSIFQSEGGSWYFVLQSGKCFRFKKVDRGNNDTSYEPYFFTSQVLFMNEKDHKRLDQYQKKQPGLTNFNFKSRPYRKNLYPVEFGIERMSPSGVTHTVFDFEEKENQVTVKGAQTKRFNEKNSTEWEKDELPLFHPGHKITQVLK